MATDALRAQVAAKWQESFNRLNRSEPGITGLMSFSEAWNIAIEALRPKDLSISPTDTTSSLQRWNAVKPSKQQVRNAFALVNQCRKLPHLLEVFLEEMRKKQPLITREVIMYMESYESTNDVQIVTKLIGRLVEWYEAWMPNPELGLGPIPTTTYTASFHTFLFSILPPTFSAGFKALVETTIRSPPHTFSHLWPIFESLGLIDRYETLIASVGYEFIEAHVKETCQQRWGQPLLPQLRTWMADTVVPWMLSPYARGAKNVDEAKVMMQGVGSRFDFHMHKTLCDLRTSEIFGIIVDYPDSTGALQDLKECMNRVDQRSDLVHALRQTNKRRLLHPGADTKDILAQYVSTIKCLRVIDPPGVLLYKVADPIRRYLRERPDTIRCIVASLVGDGESGDSLVDDNEPIQPLQQPDVENYTDPEWNPEPIDAGPDFRANKPSDVISTLVSIYDSKDLFIKELQVLLAQRLLAVTDGNYDRERRNVEILKIRFGEPALQVCEVMLKDMDDSRRTDQHVQSQKTSDMHPTIISRHFWPTLETSDLKMPGQFKALQERYAKEYSVFKPDKYLKWLPNLGRVHLELELEDRTVDADVPPLEAAFIELFSEKDVWAVDDLMSKVGTVPRSAALKALGTWVDLHVLTEDSEGVFRLLNVTEDTGARAPVPRPGAEEELPSIMSVQQQQAEQMKVYWKFVEGMLTNLGALSLDRIQTMLKIAPGYDRTIEQLAGFMEAARREGHVSVKDGMWKLAR
ncbi:ubiquitin-protein ligase [Coniophora puteana RWD-64-598 SS2]|uniref:Anaphase-promoting complex subunit 2 n=1 Tax=Coniophora puteana (strain RWD-64-598) TaxID=741705 RepID=A0A5M3MQ78_CONPW|nr:ubiquitin-protein ligase [Coniophora puteana RWD-64-598 SS2]EIW81206.1 ubiquitin-protein ligase [Coniophora puteana RWD-64-598 SS2]